MKTPESPKHSYGPYLTKHLRLDLRNRMRVQAALRGTTIEHILNVALAAGLGSVEMETAAQRRTAKMAAEVEAEVG